MNLYKIKKTGRKFFLFDGYYKTQKEMLDELNSILFSKTVICEGIDSLKPSTKKRINALYLQLKETQK
jgi:hypothetical protein